jgi:hypothetical protein
MAVVTAKDGIGEIEVFELGLQFALVLLGDFPAKDERDLLGLSDGSVHVQQALGEPVDGGAAEENQVVAKLDLGKEEPVLAAGLSALLGGEEGSESGQPLLPAAQEVLGGQRVGEFLQSFRVGALQEGVLALPKSDALLAHPKRQPMMLIEAYSSGERKVGTHANKHGPPLLVVQIETVLIDPALLQF